MTEVLSLMWEDTVRQMTFVIKGIIVLIAVWQCFSWYGQYQDKQKREEENR